MITKFADASLTIWIRIILAALGFKSYMNSITPIHILKIIHAILFVAGRTILDFWLQRKSIQPMTFR